MVPRCPGCLLLSAGLLRSSQSPCSGHLPRHLALIVMAHPSRTILVALDGAGYQVPAGRYKFVRSHAVMLTCGFTHTYPNIYLRHPDVLRGSGLGRVGTGGSGALSDDDECGHPNICYF